jgi:hypothetical protein
VVQQSFLLWAGRGTFSITSEKAVPVRERGALPFFQRDCPYGFCQNPNLPFIRQMRGDPPDAFPKK